MKYLIAPVCMLLIVWGFTWIAKKQKIFYVYDGKCDAFIEVRNDMRRAYWMTGNPRFKYFANRYHDSAKIYLDSMIINK